MLWHRLSSETLFRTATTGATTAHRPRGYLQREAGTHTAPPAPTAARTVPSPPPHKGGAARHPPPPPPPSRVKSYRAGTERPPCRAGAGSSLTAGRAEGRRRSGAAPAAPERAGPGQRGCSYPDGWTASPLLQPPPVRYPAPLVRPLAPACPPSPEPPLSQRLVHLPAPPVTYCSRSAARPARRLLH